MRTGIGLAAALWSAAAAAEPVRLTQQDCHAGMDGPCIVGLAADVLAACAGEPDAEHMPFVVLPVEIGAQPEGYAPGHYVQQWIRAAAASLGAERILSDGPASRLAITSGLGFDAWTPEGIRALGWAPGDTVRFAVPLHRRDRDLAPVLPVTEVPVFCDAWVRGIGATDIPDLTGAWIYDPSPREETGICPAENLRGDRPEPAPRNVLIIAPGGRLLVSTLIVTAGIPLDGRYPRLVSRGSWEARGPLLHMATASLMWPERERYVVIAADAETLTLRPVVDSSAFWYRDAPFTMHRCDLGMTPEEALEVIR